MSAPSLTKSWMLVMTGNRALSADVRFGSLADILGGLRHVCFTPKSGHRSARFMMSALCHFRNYARQKTVWRSARSGRRAADQPHRTAQAYAHTVRIGRQRLAERGDGGRDDLCRLVAQPAVHGADFG